MHKIMGSVSVVALAAAATFCVLGIQEASATTLVDKGVYTLDTTTGLDWLDLTLTKGYTYNQVTTNTGGANFIAQGWRYATAVELGQFFTDAGGSGTYPESTGTIGDSTWNTVMLLEDLMGTGHAGDPNWQGILADPWAPAPLLYQQGGTIISFNDPGFIDAELRTDSGGIGRDQFGFSSFLIRDHVATTPIPASLLMLATALGAMGFAGWRRRSAA
jgi:hypothetical protein